MSETSVMNAMDDALPSIGYLNVHGICRRTYGKKRKRIPTIRISLHTMLTGDTLHRNA